jgi:hypothetical protein
LGPIPNPQKILSRHKIKSIVINNLNRIIFEI